MQFTSQLHQQGAAVQTARANLNLAQRQVESLNAQRMSAEANAQLRRAQVNLEEANLAPIRSVRSRHRRCERAARHSGDGNVNPIITWVRLAQRIPVHIHIDEMPPGLLLSAGMAATVEMTVRDRGRGT